MFFVSVDGLVKKLNELEKTAAMYRGLMDHTKRLLKAFFDLSQAHKGLSLDTLEAEIIFGAVAWCWYLSPVLKNKTRRGVGVRGVGVRGVGVRGVGVRRVGVRRVGVRGVGVRRVGVRGVGVRGVGVRGIGVRGVGVRGVGVRGVGVRGVGVRGVGVRGVGVRGVGVRGVGVSIELCRQPCFVVITPLVSVLLSFKWHCLLPTAFGDVFAAIGVREPQPRASEAFTTFGDAHREIERFAIRMLKTVKPVSVRNPDTWLLHF